MSLPYAVRVLFRGSALAVADVRCRPATAAPGPEEVADGYDLVFPRSGFFVRHLGGQAFAADPNHVLLLTPDRPYRVSHPLPGGDECTVLSLSPSLLRDVVASLDSRAVDRPGPVLPPAQAPLAPGADLAHRQLVGALWRGGVAGLAAEEATLTLAGHAVEALAPVAARAWTSSRDATGARHLTIVRRVQELLAARCEEPLPLADLAAAAGCSPYHLCRVFRRVVGLPVHRYQRWLRLRRAVERLAEGERDLTTLALDLGFSDHSHFTRAFRQELLLPPSALRRREAGTALGALSKKLQAPARRAR